MRRAVVFACAPAVLWALSLAACGSDEAAGNAPVVAIDAGSGDAATLDATPDVQVDAGPPVRTVETRSRFGTLDPDNLLLDGDFELSGPDALQYPWFQFTAANVALGMQCRSGLRCARLEPGQLIAGVFVWPDGPIDAGFYAHVAGKNCASDAVGYVTPIQGYLGAPTTKLTPDSTGPGKDGYCHFTASAPLPSDTGNSFWTLIIAARQSASAAIIVDDASIKAVSGKSASSLRAAAGPPAATPSIVQRARDAYAKRPPVPPRRGPPPVFDQTGRLKLPHP